MDYELLSSSLGYLSILCWLGAQFPYVVYPSYRPLEANMYPLLIATNIYLNISAISE